MIFSMRNNMVLKPHITENLYIRYALYNNDKKRKNYYAHTLVASTFLKDYKKDMITNTEKQKIKSLC